MELTNKARSFGAAASLMFLAGCASQVDRYNTPARDLVGLTDDQKYDTLVQNGSVQFGRVLLATLPIRTWKQQFTGRFDETGKGPQRENGVITKSITVVVAVCDERGNAGSNCAFVQRYHENGMIDVMGQPMLVPSEAMANADIFARYVSSLAALVGASAQIAALPAYYKIANAQSQEAQAALNGSLGTNISNNVSPTIKGSTNINTNANYNTATARAQATAWQNQSQQQQQQQWQAMSQSQRNDLTNNFKANVPGFDHFSNKGVPYDKNNQPCTCQGPQASLIAPGRPAAFAVIQKDGKTFVQQLTKVELPKLAA